MRNHNMSNEHPLFKFHLTAPDAENGIKNAFESALMHARPYFAHFEEHDAVFIKNTLFNWLKLTLENQTQNEPPLTKGSYEEYYANFKFPRFRFQAAAQIKFI